MNSTTVALLTETWFQKRDKQLKLQLEEVELKSNISFLRRDRDKRGGGVSIAYDRNLRRIQKATP